MEIDLGCSEKKVKKRTDRAHILLATICAFLDADRIKKATKQ